MKRRPAVGDASSSSTIRFAFGAPAIGSASPFPSFAAAASMAAIRSGVISPAFSSSIFSSHWAPSAASCSSTTTAPRSIDLSISVKSASTS